jgi:ABC-2 type transport system ATP-binding protein
MTMEEYLDFFGALYGVSNRRRRGRSLADRVGLTDVFHRQIGTYSRGMQQRLGFVRALLQDPELLILDEPVSGLDPVGIRLVRGLITEENQRGKTILISSHLLSEMEKLCDRVAIMNNGQLLAEDRMDNLTKRLTKELILEIELSEVKREIVEAIDHLEFVTQVSAEGRVLRIKVPTNRDYRQEVIQTLISCGQTPLDIQTKMMNLEEAFMTITKENIFLLSRNKL